MKKSIFLFFAAILCAVSVQAEDLFLRGTFNDWGETHKFVDGTGTVTIDLTANTTYTFLVANSGWGTKYGTATITADGTKTLTKGGSDMSITTTFNGTYTFTFELSSKKLTVKYPTEDVPVETHDITVKAKYPAAWNAGKAAIHFWGTGVASPGTPAAMTKDGDWWTYTVTGVPTTSPLSVIFINGDNWNGDKNQTVDITGITESTCYQVTAGSGKATAAKADCETGEGEVIETHDITVKAFYPAAWNAGKAAIHFWGDGVASPGTPAAMEKDGDWWSYTVTGVPTTSKLSVIFINGDNWNGDANQTVDITGITESTCYQVTAGSGKATAAKADCESTPATPEPEPTELAYNVTVPAGTKACYICGNMTGWNFTEMTKVDDTHYTITIEGAKKNDGYKYASGGDWGYVEKDANGNEIGDRTYVDGNDVVARWASVYDPDAVEQELTYSVTVPEGTYACYIAMDTDPAQDGWEFNEMTKVDDTHYTFTRTGLKSKTYKYASGAGWEYVEKTDEDGEVADRTWAENDVVAKWASVYNPTAPTYDYYLTGSLVGGWDVKQQGIEKDGELYKATFNALAAGTYEFKITAGDWEHQWNYNNLGAAYEEVSQGVDGEEKPNGNIEIITEEVKNITIIFDATAGKITFDGLTPYVAPLTYTVTVPAGTEKCYIAGAFAQSNWNTFLEMEQVVGEDKFTITIIGAKETDEYKYACQADWAYAEVIDGGGNRTNWSELDEVTAWNKPVVYTYYLMGVDGDWTTGIEMEVNTGAENEVMLTCQPVNGEVKIKRLGDDESEYWYGGKSLKEEAGNLGTNTEAATDGDGNIALEEGIYNFYFNTADGKLWIAAATDCELATITLTTGNNDDIIAANIGNTVNVVIERSFTANDGFYTLCVPFNMDPSVIGKAYSLGTITEHVAGEGININLEEETYMLSAGVPYLVLPKATMSELLVENVTIESDPASGQNVTNGEGTVNIFFEGFYSAPGRTTNETTEYYVGNNGYLYNGEVEIRGLSGLFTITDENGAPLKVRARVVTREEVETGLDNNQLPNINIQKVLENGQLIIIREGVKYNVQGQKL